MVETAFKIFVRQRVECRDHFLPYQNSQNSSPQENQCGSEQRETKQKQ